MDFLIEGGRFLAIYGVFLIVLGIFLIPPNWESFLEDKTARFGIALAGVLALCLGFFLATIGG